MGKDKSMRIVVGVMIFFAILFVLSAFSRTATKIDGSSIKSAYRTAMLVKKRMPGNQGLEFDTAFGLLRQIKTENDPTNLKPFLRAVSGKKPAEIMALTRREVEAKIAAGDPAFSKYKSWDEMLDKLINSPEINRPNLAPPPTSE